MITRENYLDAKTTIKKYEKEILNLNISNSKTKCYIMHNVNERLVFVVINKVYAEKLYDSGDYIMKTTNLITL